MYMNRYVRVCVRVCVCMRVCVCVCMWVCACAYNIYDLVYMNTTHVRTYTHIQVDMETQSLTEASLTLLMM